MPDERTQAIQLNGAGSGTSVAAPIAKCVVYGAILYITVISLLALISGFFPGPDQTQVTATWKEILTFTLPVLGAWVGTVLAFYFSKENFEAANRSVRDMVGQISAQDRLKDISAKAVMVPRGSIVDIKLAAGKTDANVSLVVDVIPKFQDKVTRVPIFNDNDTVRCVIHESSAYKFLFRARANNPQADLTLKEIFGQPDCAKLITAMAFVAETVSLSDAQDAMKRLEQCQDVFVTRNGRAEEAVLGWLTNADIAKQVET
jgi:hypothetical protein